MEGSNWREGITGSTIDGRYRVQRRLGSGGMGTVYSAMDLSLDREVAIKMGRAGASKVEIERFLREARTLASLDHPNIIRIYNLGQLPNGRPYMVMELLKGKTFSALMRDGPIDPQRILDRLWEIASALDWIHERRVLHRDLKLDNLMLIQHPDGRETAKLLDFGIAIDRNGTSERLTKEGSIMGTPLYIAPELVESDVLDPRTDIYAFGVVIYQLLAGAPPYEAASPLDLLRLKMRVDAPPISVHRDDLPHAVDQVMARALSRSLRDRPKKASELIRLLARALVPAPIVSEAPQRTFAIAGSVAFLLAVLITSYATMEYAGSDLMRGSSIAPPAVKQYIAEKSEELMRSASAMSSSKKQPMPVPRKFTEPVASASR